MRWLHRGYRPFADACDCLRNNISCRNGHVKNALAKEQHRRHFYKSSPIASQSAHNTKSDQEEKTTKLKWKDKSSRRTSMERPSFIYSSIDDRRLMPSADVIHDASSWVTLLDKLLPSTFRLDTGADAGRSNSAASLSDGNSLERIPTILFLAHKHAKIDILGHLGLVQQRWDAMMWVAKTLVKLAEPLKTVEIAMRSCFNLHLPQHFTLDEFTERLTPEQLPISNHDIESTKPLKSLEELTGSRHDNSLYRKHGVATIDVAEKAIRQLWRSLGKMILKAADVEKAERQMIMSNVLQIIAMLHHNGLIPDNIYDPSAIDDPSALQQPPLINMYYSYILTCLSDVVFRHQFPELVKKNAVKQKTSELPLYIVNSVHGKPAPEIGPELWLEFVLWCCVRGGWLAEGVDIVKEMARIEKQPWSLISWEELVKLSDSSWDEVLKARRQDRMREHVPEEEESKNKTTPGRLTERKISSEVINSLADGLAFHSSRPQSHIFRDSLMDIVNNAGFLRQILHHNMLGSGMKTWDSWIMNFIGSNGAETLTDPLLMIRLLLSLKGTLAGALKGHLSRSEDIKNPLANYIFTSSAAVVDLFQKTIGVFTRARNLRGAVGCLLNLRDNPVEIKQKELAALLDKPEKTYPAFAKRKDLELLQFPSDLGYTDLRVAMSKHVLADILDLATQQGFFNLGKWMLEPSSVVDSGDNDPVIPESLYGNAELAPALFLYAARVSDNALTAKLSKVQPSDMAGRTLVTLCKIKIEEGQWQNAADILKAIDEYDLHVWSAEDVATVLQPVILCLTRRSDSETLANGADFLQKFLSKELGRLSGVHHSVLESYVALLSTAKHHLSRICTDVLEGGKEYRFVLSSQAFDRILSSSVKAYGSNVGRRLWRTWCEGSSDDSREILVRASTTTSRPSTGKMFFGQKQNKAAAAPTATFRGVVRPEMSTIRTIIEQALHEDKLKTGLDHDDDYEAADADLPNPKLVVSDVLDWAGHVLQTNFGLSNAEVDYELQGYKSSHASGWRLNSSSEYRWTPSSSAYSRSTLQVWQAFQGSRKKWALDLETRLRHFASEVGQKRMVTEALPPAERALLHNLAKDYGLASQSSGSERERAVSVHKTSVAPRVPRERVNEGVSRR